MDASSNDAFTIVGAGYRAHQPAIRKKGFWARLKGKPTLSVAVFSVIALGCLFSNLIINHDPAELFLMNVNEAPNAEFWFGTDSLGRDIYSIIWYGGRASIFIGLMSAAVITLIGVSYGCLSGVASGVVDSAMCRVRLHTQELRDAFARNIPIERLATPQDVSHSVLFLASPHASGITGEVLLVDGGIIARQALPKV